MHLDNSRLLRYIQSCTSPYHTVDTSLQLLLDEGFTELFMEEPWNLKAGNYVVNVYGTTLFAFHIGCDYRQSLRIASAHTDFPAIRVKPNPIIKVQGYTKLNVELYGGLIQNTWLDRPLAAAGTVVLKGEMPYDVESVLVDTKRPVAIIPNLAIHMNRSINEGVPLNKQKEMLPLLMMNESSMHHRGTNEEGTQHDEWMSLLAQEVNCDVSEILSYEIGLYPVVAGVEVGANSDFIASPRLDNLTSCFGVLTGIIESKTKEADGIRCVILFDNEEVGSRTKQGGAGMLLPNLLERVYRGLGLSEEELAIDVASGFMISADVAHGLHPNYVEKYDITNLPTLNGGVTLKVAASQSYAGDAKAFAIVKGLCEASGAAYQVFVNRSDSPGGSTVGSISSAMLPMRTMDIGLPLLAMHSAVETMGAHDQEQLSRLMKYFLGES